MLKRLVYTVKKATQYRKQLLKLRDSDAHFDEVINIQENWLKEHSIKVLVLDFDGVLAAHGEDIINKQVCNWLDKTAKILGGDHIYILSNRPTKVRNDFFKENYPQIRFISGVRKKPYPDGLLEIMKLSNVKNNHIALTDDRLLTGCLASLIAGCQPIWITKAYANYKTHPFQESFFAILRKMDRCFISIW